MYVSKLDPSLSWSDAASLTRWKEENPTDPRGALVLVIPEPEEAAT